MQLLVRRTKAKREPNVVHAFAYRQSTSDDAVAACGSVMTIGSLIEGEPSDVTCGKCTQRLSQRPPS